MRDRLFVLRSLRQFTEEVHYLRTYYKSAPETLRLAPRLQASTLHRIRVLGDPAISSTLYPN